MNQPAQMRTLLQFISTTSGPLSSFVSFSCLRSSVICINLLATATCRARLYAYSLKHSYLPPEVALLFGAMRPSEGHAKRMCRILRSEAWRQVRFYTDCLQFLNRNELPYPSAQKKFIEDLRLASQTADFLAVFLTSVNMNQPAQMRTLLQFISTTSGPLSSFVSFSCLRSSVICINLLATATCRARLYAYSLKHSYLPPEVALLFGAMRPSEGHAKRMCRILRSEAWRQVRFYTDCLQFLNRNELPYPSAQKKFIEDLRLASQTADFLLRTMVTSLREAGLKLLLSDKEGGFVVLPRSLYKEKAAAAILENFNEVKGVVPAKVKTRAVQLCEKPDLQNWLSL
ncbi:hypothetical protein HPB51_003785 [Rhipicephalus microplus]|uniref:Uncharacterized protein n=1 Tax=Rhipicephalus microplus TaxID=6941 RepID=A0A9J6DF74_RHIMP|nr:hypothetical protein HPB51_003785 [Rhipicephalus microplus]